MAALLRRHVPKSSRSINVAGGTLPAAAVLNRQLPISNTKTDGAGAGKQGFDQMSVETHDSAFQTIPYEKPSSRIRIALRLLTVGLLLAVGLQMSPARSQSVGQPPDTMAARVEACTPCHGNKGEGTSDVYFPRLAGKPAGYLYNQLLAFRGGRRKYPPMNYLLEFLPDSYLQEMADYFASQRPPLPQPVTSEASGDVLRRGEALVSGGDAAAQIPACASCHGPGLTGMEPGIPGLLGLRPSYVSAQLGAWRYGTRTAKAPDCMQRVAARLTEADVTAVAAYLATLPVSENAAPSPKGAYALPFSCGSAPN